MGSQKISIKNILLTMVAVCAAYACVGQNVYNISGNVVDAVTKRPIQNASVHIAGYAGWTITKQDGSFAILLDGWYDTLEITSIGYEPFKKFLQKKQNIAFTAEMKPIFGLLQNVVVSTGKKPAKTLMQQVIEHKPINNPARFTRYSYESYTRNELDVDNLDFKQLDKKGLKGLMANIYNVFDSTAKGDRELPIYFAEYLTKNYHSVYPRVEKEIILARKILGLKTDEFLRQLEKFHFRFNIYEDWIPIFDQTYASPLNKNAFDYYNFFSGDTLRENGNVFINIRFTPLRPYERSFSGTLWINEKSYAVERADMHIAKTANLNFIDKINYTEEYKLIYDSAQGKDVYLPWKYSSEVKFEAGPELLGIPVPGNKNTLHVGMKSNTIITAINLLANEPSAVEDNFLKQVQTGAVDKTDNYWEQHRTEPLTRHEQGIYKMVDSLKENKFFQRDIRLIAFAGSGYWDFRDKIRIGPYTSFISKNSIEGFRFRLGFWTMPGMGRHLNFYGHAAYGTKDRKLKGGVGLKYVWNEAKWTKTTLWAGSDYDFMIDRSDELDKDNIISSLLRKNIPYSRIYVKQVILKHEQFLSEDFSGRVSLAYKELNPVFDFSYSPLNPILEMPVDSVSLKLLPVAEASIGLRYAHQEKTAVLNYDQLHLGTFNPVITVNYTHGFQLSKTNLEYDKISVGIEQKLRLPPKSILYYNLSAGKVFGTLPYLLLNIPAGNEFYVSSKYQFNTMTPYEFSADRYVSLHTRLSLGGTLFDEVSFLRKLGWRERLSCNIYWGDMTPENVAYNKKSNFNSVGRGPFAEAAVGIENIFHILSVDYYRRFTYLNNPYAKKDGIYIGVNISF